MKNSIRLTAFFVVILGTCGNAQVKSLKNIFQKKAIAQQDFHNISSSYQLLELNPQNLTSARTMPGQNAELTLPFENSELILDLQPATITSPRFSVIEAGTGGSTRRVAYTLPSFYQGKIKGADKSFATVSMFNNQVIGIMSDEKSNIILGAIEQNGRATNQYALYRDIDLKVKAAMKCLTGETPVDGPSTASSATSPSARVTAVGQPIEIYFECDYQFYQDKGSNVSNVVNYVLSFFSIASHLFMRMKASRCRYRRLKFGQHPILIPR